MSLELQQKAYTAHRQGLKPERIIPAPVKSFSGIHSVWTGEDEGKKTQPFPLRNDGWGRGERGHAGSLLAPCLSAGSAATSVGQRRLCKPCSYIVASQLNEILATLRESLEDSRRQSPQRGFASGQGRSLHGGITATHLGNSLLSTEHL